MRKFSHWIEAFHYMNPYTLNVQVTAKDTSGAVQDWRTKKICEQHDLPFCFNSLKADIGKATGLSGYELDLFLADHRRRLAGQATIGTKGQWDYAEPLLLKWFYRLSGSVTQLKEELGGTYPHLRVAIHTPFSCLCSQWGYNCSESTIIFSHLQPEKAPEK